MTLPVVTAEILDAFRCLAGNMVTVAVGEESFYGELVGLAAIANAQVGDPSDHFAVIVKDVVSGELRAIAMCDISYWRSDKPL